MLRQPDNCTAHCSREQPEVGGHREHLTRTLDLGLSQRGCVPLARPLTLLGTCLHPQGPPSTGFQPPPQRRAQGRLYSSAVLTALCSVAWGRHILGCSCPAGEVTHPPRKEAEASSPWGGLRVRAPREDTAGTKSECCAQGHHFSSTGSAQAAGLPGLTGGFLSLSLSLPPKLHFRMCCFSFGPKNPKRLYGR